jgi:hypothetical protein
MAYTKTIELDLEANFDLGLVLAIATVARWKLLRNSLDAGLGCDAGFAARDIVRIERFAARVDGLPFPSL